MLVKFYQIQVKREGNYIPVCDIDYKDSEVYNELRTLRRHHPEFSFRKQYLYTQDVVVLTWRNLK